VPLNVRVGGVEIPLGLFLITLLLFLLAIINVFTKKIATISGVTFTLLFFTAFTLSEKYIKTNDKEGIPDKQKGKFDEGGIEKFRLETRNNVSSESLHVRPGNILVEVHDPNKLSYLEKLLEGTAPKKFDVVVFSMNPNAANESSSPDELAARVFDDCETLLFSRVVHVAEKVGKPVSLIAAPGKDVYCLILTAAQKLSSSRVVIGASSPANSGEQERNMRRAWEQLPNPRPTLSVEIVRDGGRVPVHFDLRA
jgi:hypothetical protein